MDFQKNVFLEGADNLLNPFDVEKILFSLS